MYSAFHDVIGVDVLSLDIFHLSCLCRCVNLNFAKIYSLRMDVFLLMPF